MHIDEKRDVDWGGSGSAFAGNRTPSSLIVYRRRFPRQ